MGQPGKGNSMEAKRSEPTEALKAASRAAPATAPCSQQPPGAERALLARLLNMADRYRDEGAIEQAKEMYFSLAESHADAPEAARARERLIEIAEHYEAGGQLRWARSMYERLL